jgi:hypothetical protein
MTQEEQQRFVNDLSARVPYGLQVQVSGVFSETVEARLKYIDYYNRVYLYGYNFGVEMINRKTNELQIKPFLRPISNEEKEEVCSDFARFGNTLDNWVQAVNLLNETHCDYNGWIEKGFALPAPDEMYND